METTQPKDIVAITYYEQIVGVYDLGTVEGCRSLLADCIDANLDRELKGEPFDWQLWGHRNTLGYCLIAKSHQETQGAAWREMAQDEVSASSNDNHIFETRETVESLIRDLEQDDDAERLAMARAVLRLITEAGG